MSVFQSIRMSRNSKWFAVELGAIILLLIAQPFLWSKVHVQASNLQQQRIQLKQIADLEARTKDIQKSYDQQKVFLEQLNSVVPASKDTLQVIERLETLMPSSTLTSEVSRIDEGAPLKSLTDLQENKPAGTTSPESASSAGSTAAQRQVIPLYVTLTVKGQPNELLEYIDSLEHVPEISRIQKFTLSAVSQNPNTSSSSSDNKFQLIMTILFYLQS